MSSRLIYYTTGIGMNMTLTEKDGEYCYDISFRRPPAELVERLGGDHFSGVAETPYEAAEQAHETMIELQYLLTQLLLEEEVKLVGELQEHGVKHIHWMTDGLKGFVIVKGANATVHSFTPKGVVTFARALEKEQIPEECAPRLSFIVYTAKVMQSLLSAYGGLLVVLTQLKKNEKGVWIRGE